MISYWLTILYKTDKLFFSPVNISSWATENSKDPPTWTVHIFHRESIFSSFNKENSYTTARSRALTSAFSNNSSSRHTCVCLCDSPTVPHHKQPTDSLKRMPNKPSDLCWTERTSGLRSSIHLRSDSLVSQHLHHARYKLAQTSKWIRKGRFGALKLFFRETLTEIPIYAFSLHETCLHFTFKVKIISTRQILTPITTHNTCAYSIEVKKLHFIPFKRPNIKTSRYFIHKVYSTLLLFRIHNHYTTSNDIIIILYNLYNHYIL